MAGRGMVLGKAGAEAVRLVDGFNIGRRGYATQLAGVFVARTSRDCGCKRRLTRGSRHSKDGNEGLVVERRGWSTAPSSRGAATLTRVRLRSAEYQFRTSNVLLFRSAPTKHRKIGPELRYNFVKRRRLSGIARGEGGRMPAHAGNLALAGLAESVSKPRSARRQM